MTVTEHDLALLTIEEAAAVADVAPGTVRSWISRYGLETVTALDGRTLISERALLDCEYERRHAGRGRRRAS